MYSTNDFLVGLDDSRIHFFLLVFVVTPYLLRFLTDFYQILYRTSSSQYLETFIHESSILSILVDGLMKKWINYRTSLVRNCTSNIDDNFFHETIELSKLKPYKLEIPKVLVAYNDVIITGFGSLLSQGKLHKSI